MPSRRRARTVPADLRRARLAVVTLFLVNGMGYACVVPWLPAIKNDLSLSNVALGGAVAAVPLGGLMFGMLAGPLIGRFGSARVAVAAGAALSLALPLVALAPNWIVLVGVLFWLGAADAWMDSAMNAHGLRVQRRYGRSIIVVFHAAWSIGAVAGGLVGAGAADLRVPMLVFFVLVTAFLTVLYLLAARFTLPGPEHAERADDTGTGRPADALRAIGGSARLLLALALLLMLAGAVEDSAAAWGAVYMRGELGTSAFLAGLPFVACQALMTAGRLTGDRLTDRFGPVAVARTGATLATIGLGGALLFPSPATTIIGFALSGMGIATLFPLGLAAAGQVPGVRSGDGVTIVAWLARAGFFAFPPVVGAIADAASLRAGLAIIPIAGAAAAVLAGALRPHEVPADRSGVR